MEYNNIFAKRLKEYMEDNNLSFREMEKKTGIPAQTLNRYVLGQRTPKIDVIPELAAKLNVSDSWLIGLEYDTEKYEPATVTVDKLTQEIIKKLDALTPENRSIALAQLDFLLLFLLGST